MKAVVFLMPLLFLSPSFLWAEDVFDIAASYNKKKNQVLDLQSKKRKVLAEIYSIEKETNKIVLKKSEIDNKKLKLDGDLARVSKKIIAIESELQLLTADLMERFSFTEQVNDLPWFYTLLTSQSLLDLDHMFATATNLNDQQMKVVANFSNLLGELNEQKKVLNSVALEIVNLKRDIVEKERNISKNQKSKKIALKFLEKTISNEKKKLKKIKGKGRKALAQSEFSDLEMLFGTGFFEQKGKLPHPVSVPVTHAYGLNKGLVSDQVQLVHKGYFYTTPLKQKVRVVSGGRVRFAGKVSGYGKVIVVDHGSRYYTTYANLSEVDIKKGSEVKKGELIGKTGHRHLQFKLGLYFEIRHFSQPQNPSIWLKPQDGRLAKL